MAARDTVVRLLREAGMRRTGPRQSVLEELMDSEHALSHQEIEARVGEKVDRVTIYRILAAFEEHGLVHKVHDSSGVPKYATCSEDCDDDSHADDHLHFHCIACGRTWCLEEIDLPGLHLPAGFEVEQVEIVAHGLCEACRS